MKHVGKLSPDPSFLAMMELNEPILELAAVEVKGTYVALDPDGLERTEGAAPGESKNGKDDDSEHEWDLPRLNKDDILMGTVTQWDKYTDEVWVTIHQPRRFGIMVECQPEVVGFKDGYPLLRGPPTMHLSDDESPDPDPPDPTNNQPQVSQSPQKPAGSQTSFPPAAGESDQISDPPNNQYRSIKADTRPVCRQYSSGKCTYGNRCNFRHPDFPGLQQRDPYPGGDARGISESKLLLLLSTFRDWICKYGDSCREAHTRPAWSPSDPPASNAHVKPGSQVAPGTQVLYRADHVSTSSGSA